MSQKTEGIRFRESLKGYNKGDVNAFIEQQDRLFAEAEGDYRRRLEAADHKIAELTAQNQELTDRLNVSRESTDLGDKLAQAESRIAEITQQLAQKDAELEAAGKRMGMLEQKLGESGGGDGPIDGEHEKAQLYDRMSRKIGDMFLSAGESADKIVSDARRNAEQITEEAETMRRGTAEALQRLREEAAAGFRAMAEEELRAVEEYGTGIMKSLSDVLDSFRSGSAELQSGNSEKVRQLYEELLGRIDSVRSEAQEKEPQEKDEQ